MTKLLFYPALIILLFLSIILMVFYTPISGDDILSLTYYPKNFMHDIFNWNSRLGEIFGRVFFKPPYHVIILPILVMLFYYSVFLIGFGRYPKFNNSKDVLVVMFLVFMTLFLKFDIGVFTNMDFAGNYVLPSIIFALIYRCITLFLRNNFDVFKYKFKTIALLFLILLGSASHELIAIFSIASLGYVIIFTNYNKNNLKYLLPLVIPAILGFLWCMIGGLGRLKLSTESISYFQFFYNEWIKQVFGYFSLSTILIILMYIPIRKRINLKTNIKQHILEILLIISVPIIALVLKTYSIRVHTLSAFFLFAILARIFALYIYTYKYFLKFAILLSLFTLGFIFWYDFSRLRLQSIQRKLWEDMVVSQITETNPTAYVFAENKYQKSQHSFIALTKSYQQDFGALFPYEPYMVLKYNLKSPINIIIDDRIPNPMNDLSINK